MVLAMATAPPGGLPSTPARFRKPWPSRGERAQCQDGHGCRDLCPSNFPIFPLEGPCFYPPYPVPCPLSQSRTNTPPACLPPRATAQPSSSGALPESFSGGGHFMCGIHCIRQAVLCSVAGSEAARMGRRAVRRGLEPAGLDLSPILSCDRLPALGRVIEPRRHRFLTRRPEMMA